MRGIPKRIQVDNVSEFISKALDKWAYDNGVVLDFSRPGKPTDNPFIESFNGSMRDECLNVHWFLLIEDACEKIERWRQEYNRIRPHSSLGDLTPGEFRDQHQEARTIPVMVSVLGEDLKGSGLCDCFFFSLLLRFC